MKIFYKCDNCGKTFLDKDTCMIHEKDCMYVHPIERIALEYNYYRKHQEYQLEIHKYPLAIIKDNCFRLSPEWDYFDETITLNEIKFEHENLIYVYIDNFSEEDTYIKKLFEFRRNQLKKEANKIAEAGSYLTRIESDYSWDGNKIIKIYNDMEDNYNEKDFICN